VCVLADVFYTAPGHRDDIWSNDPVFRAHVAGGIRWALSLEP
jgi:type 1 glutamine amidotransferase